MGRLPPIAETMAPVKASDTTHVRRGAEQPAQEPLSVLYGIGDTIIGFVPGTADTTKRYLGRLRQGYVADTLNLFLCGDNRPAYRTARLKPQFLALKEMASLNPVKWAKGLVALPIILVKGMIPDAALIRDIGPAFSHRPTYGREESVNHAMLAKLDSLHARGQSVAAVINTGDVVKDGRYPIQWQRFLRLVRPLSRQVPYFAIAGNHERTDTVNGVENWRTATGLPVGGERLYYCFDSADGWVRFIALDSNPMTDPANHWTREVQVKYSDEMINWLVARLKEHKGPSLVFMHHPPFSAGFHRVEWQSDDVLRARRARMVKAMRESGISILAAGHEHAYERALLTGGNAVLIVLVTGGAGTPLHVIPTGNTAAQLFASYNVEDARFRPEDVFVSESFHFIHLRMWFGGGEFFTFAVEKDGSTKLIDKVAIDLKRYGVPKIDQHKIPIPEEGPKQPPPPEETKGKKAITAKSDSISASKRLEASPPPGKKRRVR
jgi:predicted MPP superfamily phosphohydrolase